MKKLVSIILLFCICNYVNAQTKYIKKSFAFAMQGVGGAQPVNDNGEPITPIPHPIEYKIYFISPFASGMQTFFLYTNNGTYYKGVLHKVTQQPVTFYNGDVLIPTQTSTLYQIAFEKVDILLLPAAIKKILLKQEGVVTFTYKNKTQTLLIKQFIKKTILYP
jgi:hypothetical protein